MWNDIANIKDAIFLFFPLVITHLYIYQIYGIHTWQLFFWWFRKIFIPGNHATIGKLAAFFIFGGLFFMATMSLMNNVYLNIFGEKQTLVYLGNYKKNTSLYYKYGDEKRILFNGYNPDVEFNTSFENIYRLETLVKDPGTEERVGTKNNRLGFSALTVFFLLTISFGVLFTLAIHAFVYPMYLEKAGKSEATVMDIFDSYDRFMTPVNMTSGITLLIFGAGIGLSLLIIVFFVPSDNYGERVEMLPSVVRPANHLTGLPVLQEVEYMSRSDDHGGSETYDTGYRYVVFKFDWEFNKDVYVAMKYHKKDFPKLQALMDYNISNIYKVSLSLNDKLELLPIK